MDLEALIDARSLENAVGRMLGANAAVLEVEAASLRPVNVSAVESAVHALSGLARVGRRTRRWSMVAKVASRPPGASRPGDWDYWRRETDAFASGFLDRLRGMRAPRCYGVRHQGDAAILYMERVAERSRWGPARYALAARQLGELNGSYLGPRLPRFGWLCRDVFRKGVEANDASYIDDAALWRNRLVQRAFPPSARGLLRRVLSGAAGAVARLGTMPSCLTHLDAYRENLIAQGRNTVLIDFAFLGTAAVGVDAGQMLAGNLLWGHVPARGVPAHIRAVTSSYLKGLAKAGARVDARDVAWAAAASGAIRVASFLPVMLSWLADRRGHAMWRAKFGAPPGENVESWGASLQYLLSLGVRE